MWGMFIGGMLKLTNVGALLKRFYREILIVLLLILLFFLYQRLNSKDRKIESLKSLYQASTAEMKQWKDKHGKNHTMVAAAVISPADLKYAMDSSLQNLQKEIGSLKRNLISYSRISTTTEASFKAPIRDTIVVINEMERLPAKVIQFKDPYIEFKQLILADSAITSYSIKNDFEYYHYYKKPGKFPWNIFKRKEAVAEIKFKNPNTKGDSIYTLVLKRKK